MGKIYYRILISALVVLFFQSMTGAVSSEYKNSLEKVELHKTGENNYDVNLYMQKNYTSPVKIIKKNDLNYYILLPETKNSSSVSNFKTKEIQSISADLYPYAGVDVNNGYTKININTTKPLDFNLVIMNPPSASKPVVNTPVVAQKNVEEIKTKEETKTEKKTQNSAKINSKETPLTKDKEKQTVIKKEVNPVINEKKPTTATNSIKSIIKPKITVNKESVGQKQNKKVQDIQKVDKKVEPVNIQEDVEENKVKAYNERSEEIKENSVDNNNINTEEYFDDDSALIASSAVANEEEYAYAAKIPSAEDVETKTLNILQSIKNKLGEYDIGLFDVIFMITTTLCLFVVILFIMSNRQNGPKIKRKVDLFDLNEKSSLTPKKTSGNDSKNNGQYFVFDNNVKQTGLLDPATSSIKKNYELSSYDPDLNTNYSYNSIASNQDGESEYDIIQKILKEDAYIEINQKQAETITKEKIAQNKTVEEIKKHEESELQKSSAVTSPIARNNTLPAENTETTEGLNVLSKEEIAPERGFMCVSYENNISLIGYIFDDIFVLHNFKKPELENYDIQYRLSEKDDDKGALYIVKVAEEKMIVKVDAKTMKLEITL